MAYLRTLHSANTLRNTTSSETLYSAGSCKFFVALHAIVTCCLPRNNRQQPRAIHLIFHNVQRASEHPLRPLCVSPFWVPVIHWWHLQWRFEDCQFCSTDLWLSAGDDARFERGYVHSLHRKTIAPLHPWAWHFLEGGSFLKVQLRDPVQVPLSSTAIYQHEYGVASQHSQHWFILPLGGPPSRSTLHSEHLSPGSYKKSSNFLWSLPSWCCDPGKNTPTKKKSFKFLAAGNPPTQCDSDGRNPVPNKNTWNPSTQIPEILQTSIG